MMIRITKGRILSSNLVTEVEKFREVLLNKKETCPISTVHPSTKTDKYPLMKSWWVELVLLQLKSNTPLKEANINSNNNMATMIISKDNSTIYHNSSKWGQWLRRTSNRTNSIELRLTLTKTGQSKARSDGGKCKAIRCGRRKQEPGSNSGTRIFFVP